MGGEQDCPRLLGLTDAAPQRTPRRRVQARARLVLQNKTKVRQRYARCVAVFDAVHGGLV